MKNVMKDMITEQELVEALKVFDGSTGGELRRVVKNLSAKLIANFVLSTFLTAFSSSVHLDVEF